MRVSSLGICARFRADIPRHRRNNDPRASSPSIRSRTPPPSGRPPRASRRRIWSGRPSRRVRSRTHHLSDNPPHTCGCTARCCCDPFRVYFPAPRTAVDTNIPSSYLRADPSDNSICRRDTNRVNKNLGKRKASSSPESLSCHHFFRDPCDPWATRFPISHRNRCTRKCPRNSNSRDALPCDTSSSPPLWVWAWAWASLLPRYPAYADV